MRNSALGLGLFWGYVYIKNGGDIAAFVLQSAS